MAEKINVERIRELLGRATARPWAYQENTDAYTHILRGLEDKYILGGSRHSNGRVETDMRLAAEAVTAIEQLLQLHDVAEGLLRIVDLWCPPTQGDPDRSEEDAALHAARCGLMEALGH